MVYALVVERLSTSLPPTIFRMPPRTGGPASSVPLDPRALRQPNNCSARLISNTVAASDFVGEHILVRRYSCKKLIVVKLQVTERLCASPLCRHLRSCEATSTVSRLHNH